MCVTSGISPVLTFFSLWMDFPTVIIPMLLLVETLGKRLGVFLEFCRTSDKKFKFQVQKNRYKVKYPQY